MLNITDCQVPNSPCRQAQPMGRPMGGAQVKNGTVGTHLPFVYRARRARIRGLEIFQGNEDIEPIPCNVMVESNTKKG